MIRASARLSPGGWLARLRGWLNEPTAGRPDPGGWALARHAETIERLMRARL